MDNMEGVIVPLVTPLTKEENIDIPDLERLLEHVIAGGVNGVFVLSTSGETVRLCGSQKGKMLKKVMEVCRGRVDVYVGIMDTGLKKVLINLDRAVELGAKAAVLSPPYCYHISDGEMIEFFLKVAEKSPIPLMLYNIPSVVGTAVSSRVYEEVKGCRNIIGVKDSSGDINILRDLIAEHASNDFKVFVGSEDIMLEGLKLGASGIVPSLGNVFPKLLTDFYDAFVKNDFSRAEYLLNIIKEFNAIYNQPESALAPILVRKQALELLGISKSWMTGPGMRSDTDSTPRIKEYISRNESFLGL